MSKCTCNGAMPHLVGCPVYALFDIPMRQNNAHANLVEAIEIHEQHGAVYRNHYNEIGEVLAAMFPDGLKLCGAIEMARFSTFLQCTNKLSRYAKQFSKGGHEDSARDLIVYAAMLQEQTTNGSS